MAAMPWEQVAGADEQGVAGTSQVAQDSAHGEIVFVKR
jgi:hypothetical protein